METTNAPDALGPDHIPEHAPDALPTATEAETRQHIVLILQAPDRAAAQVNVASATSRQTILDMLAHMHDMQPADHPYSTAS